MRPSLDCFAAAVQPEKGVGGGGSSGSACCALDRHPPGADMNAMSRTGPSLALALMLFGTAAAATEPNVLAPYRYQPAPQTLSPVEQQKALAYRNQIQSQLRQLEQRRTPGPGARDPSLLPQTRTELGRINRLVNPNR